MHLTRNQAYLHGYRGFKSLSLRQSSRQDLHTRYLRRRGRFINRDDLPLVRCLLAEPHLTVADHRPRRIAEETLGCLMQDGIAHRIRKDEAVVGQERLFLLYVGPLS